MSTEEQNQAGSEANVQSEQGSSQPDTTDVVKREAYEGVTKDLHKFKSKAKNAEAKANELEVRLKAIEEEKLKEQEEYKALFEKRNQEYEELKTSVDQEKSKYLKSVKLNALKNELGGKVKDAYLIHAQIDSIEFNDDGSLNPESVTAVANAFREEHSSLIPSESNNLITNPAPSNSAPLPKTLQDMSTKEKLALLKK